MSKKKSTLEEKILKLEELASKVENGELSINEIITVHKESTRLINECKEAILQIENEIINNNTKK
jgi:exodeoxyribonuclease VII small subunit